MNKHKYISVFFIAIFTVGLAAEGLQSCLAQSSSVIGYPYIGSGAGSSDPQYDVIGSMFTLNGEATVNSMSAYIHYTPNYDRSYQYRFAIYQDIDGCVGALVSQTNPGVFSGSQWGWRAANFPQTVQLSSGSYWLVLMDDAVSSKTNYGLEPTADKKVLISTLSGLEYPSTLPTNTHYSSGYTCCIYASGETISTPTPTLTPTPTITSTPTPTQNVPTATPPPPTPTPAPPRTPTLTVSCQSVLTESAIKVHIMGQLTDNGAGMPNKAIEISYSASNGNSWQTLPLALTRSDGVFYTEWYPTATGNYLIKVSFSGDPTHTQVNAIANLPITEGPSNSNLAFSVTSNSTVSALLFNSKTSQLSFDVTGTNGTAGYVDITIARSLVPDMDSLKTYFDGEPINYSGTFTVDAVILHFTYHHSTHTIAVNLDENAFGSTPEGTVSQGSMGSSDFTLLLVGVLAALIIAAFCGGYVAIRKNRNTINQRKNS